MKFLFLSFCIIFLVNDPFAMSGQLCGTVFDNKTLETLEGANITLNDTSFGTASGTTGRFDFVNIPTGKYTITVSYIGYKSVQKDVYVAENRKTDLNIYLEPLTIDGESIIVSAKAEPNHAIERTSPIAFQRLHKEELQSYYTTGDLPDLIK